MGRVNSQSRISTRRKAALIRRQANVKNYNTLLSSGQITDLKQIETIERRIALAESEVAILKKATGTF
jgi:predicted methyltransferase MtxX (methanogen marker protein 4)